MAVANGFRFNLERSPRQFGGSDGPEFSKWLRADLGGYTQASCKCEIECTPDNIDEICGADVVIAIDMTKCEDAEDLKRYSSFVDSVINNLETELGLGGDRSTARVSVGLFGAELVPVMKLSEWNVDISDLDSAKRNFKSEMKKFTEGGTWTIFNGGQLDFNTAFDFALEQFDTTARNPGIDMEMSELGFDPTKLFVIFSDGQVAQNTMNKAAMQDLEMAKTEINALGGKVVTVTQSSSDDIRCLHGQSMGCPHREFLLEVGDVYIDGANAVKASREVAAIVNSKKCIKRGECKPCNCECEMPRGPAGPEGNMGCDGCRGPPGQPGKPGKEGIDGVPGEKGPQGPQGDNGDCGEPGYPGERGPPGEPATRGGDAEQGPVGFPGERGECGDAGEMGEKGVPGCDGPVGDTGEVGEKGQTGDAGQPGPPGDLLLRIAHRAELQTPENLEANIREIVKEWLADENNRASIECIDPDCEPGSQLRESPAETTPECGPNEIYDEDKCRGDRTCNPCVQKPDLDACQEPLDIIFMVDGSDSIRAEDWPKVSDWIAKLMDMIKPTERAQDTAVLYQQYSDSSDFPPSIFETIKSKTDPDNAGFFYDNLIDRIRNERQRSSSTHTYHALDQINKALSNNLRSTQNGLNFQQNGFDEITTILIHLTDGEARDPQNRQQAVIDQLIQRVDSKLKMASFYHF